MPDSKNHIGEPDRSLVSGEEHYEVQHLAERTGISTDEARELIARHGHNRETLEREAAKLRRN